MREGSQQDAKEMVIWGTPAVKTDRFSVALPAPEVPDLLGLACAGSAWGVGARSVPACRKEPWEGFASVTLALPSVAAWLVPSLLPPVMAGAQLFTAMAQGEEQLSRSRIVGHWNYIN